MSGCGSSFSCCESTTSPMIYKGSRDRGRVSFVFLLLAIYRSTTFVSHAISACLPSPLYTWPLSLSSTTNTQAVAHLSPVTLLMSFSNPLMICRSLESSDILLCLSFVFLYAIEDLHQSLDLGLFLLFCHIHVAVVSVLRCCRAL